MANKLVGKYGDVFLRSIVTRKGGSVLPISRSSKKLEAALPLLMGNIAVDFGACTVDVNVYSADLIYSVMNDLGYTWDVTEQKWQRHWRNIFEVS